MSITIMSQMTNAEAVSWRSRLCGAANQLRELLLEGYERQAWITLGYSNWTECIKSLAEEFGFSERHMWRLHAANITQGLLTPGSVETIPEKQLRPLTALEPDEQVAVWQQVVETAPDGNITASHVQDVVDHYSESRNRNGSRAHVSNNTGEQEWYTPPEYIDAARRTMGTIDLDPASCEIANQTVKAEAYYTKENDGLALSWYGRIWLNPPYSQPDIEHFANKLVSNLSDIEQACVLVNNATETDWFQSLLRDADAVCFPNKRIKFIDKNGDPRGAPLQGQAVLYFGDKRASFDQWFSQFGPVLYGRH